jgi:hypothetical protein
VTLAISQACVGDEVLTMGNQNDFREGNLHQMQYTLLTEVLGRWKADIIESFLRAEEIDVVLVQENAADLFTTSFAPVKIFVPKASFQRALNLLKTFDETQENTGKAENGE